MARLIKNCNKLLRISSQTVSIQNVLDVSSNYCMVQMDTSDTQWIDKLNRSRQNLEKITADPKNQVYGVNTSVGEACERHIPPDRIEEFQYNIIDGHQTGTGDIFNDNQLKATVFIRLVQLTRGYSAITMELAYAMINMLNYNILPCIPKQGSIGASGDLVPLAYVAAATYGSKQTNVTFNGKIMSAYDAWKQLPDDVQPCRLHSKEGLSIINGTAVGCALLTLCIPKVMELVKISAALTGATSNILSGNPTHFDERIFAVKPHPGLQKYASYLRQFVDHLKPDELLKYANDGRIQQRYSTRASPHIAGITLDVLDWIYPWLIVEINCTSDNPLIDPDSEDNDTLHGANFYGGHLCLMSDTLKNCVASISDMLDRQLILLFDPTVSHNLLPQDLSVEDYLIGLKGFSLTSSSLTAEAMHMVQPMSVFSRSSEGHNQDKVSMCTHAGKQLIKIVDIVQRNCALNLISVAQAVDVRLSDYKSSKNDGFHAVPLNPRCILMRDYVREMGIPFIGNTAVNMHEPLQRMVNAIQNGSVSEFIEKHIFHDE
eukprot:384135_1